MRPLALFVVAANALLAACASTTPGPTQHGGDCFRSDNVAGYSIIDDHNIRVRIVGNRTYTLSTTWNVNDLDWTHAMQLRSDTGWICTGNVFGRVEVIGGSLNQRYPIQTVTRDPEPPADQQGS